MSEDKRLADTAKGFKKIEVHQQKVEEVEKIKETFECELFWLVTEYSHRLQKEANLTPKEAYKTLMDAAIEKLKADWEFLYEDEDK